MFTFRSAPGAIIRSFRVLFGAGLSLALAGCVNTTYPPRPIVPADTAAAFDARSLDDPALRNFLAENLGPDFAPGSVVTWNFETLAWVAFYYNPSLDVARAQWQEARAGIRSAGTRPNPLLTLTPGYSTNPGAGISPWFPGITADQVLVDSRKTRQKAAVAEHTADAARQAVFAAAWKIRSELRRALVDGAAAEPRLEILRAQAATQHRAVMLLEQRLKAGALSATEISSARLAEIRTEALVVDAERQLPLARQRVAVALGVPAHALDGIPLPRPQITPPLAPGQLAAARRESLRSRPDILAALARYEASESALALEIARQFPDFHLGPGYMWDQGQNKWSLGLTLELPLFNHNEGPIAEAAARRREAAANFLATQAQAVAEIDAAASAQATATAQVGYRRRAQSNLQTLRNNVAIRRRTGAADQLDVETAGLEAEAASLAVREAETQAELAAGQLEDALQIPFAHFAALGNLSAANHPSSP